MDEEPVVSGLVLYCVYHDELEALDEDFYQRGVNGKVEVYDAKGNKVRLEELSDSCCPLLGFLYRKGDKFVFRTIFEITEDESSDDI